MPRNPAVLRIGRRCNPGVCWIRCGSGFATCITSAHDDSRADLARRVPALQSRLPELTRIAHAATSSYDRLAWFRYALIFVPVPFTLGAAGAARRGIFG